MNRYAAYFNGRVSEVSAETSYSAQKVAAELFKVRESKRYLITVMLIEKDGKRVSHSTAAL